MTLSTLFSPVAKSELSQLMPIETACHSHPWSEKTFLSCIGGRYFGEKLHQEGIAQSSSALSDSTQSENSQSDDSQNIIGFYIGELVLDEATLMDICVKPAQQGHGFGKALLNQFIAQAKRKGASKIWLEVRAKNISAQMLYMNAGFIETGRRTGYYPSASGFGYEDAIVMSLSL